MPDGLAKLLSTLGKGGKIKRIYREITENVRIKIVRIWYKTV